MTQAATPESVQAPFDGRTLRAGGFSAIVEQRGDEFWYRQLTSPQLPEIPAREVRIVMTTGSHRLQGYWHLNDEGQYQFLPWVYNIKDQRWVLDDDTRLRPAESVRPIGLAAQFRWNDSCVNCHATAGIRKPTPFDDPTVVEVGIACEACHGPALAHIEAQQNPLARYARHLSPSEPKDLMNGRDGELCGTCHALLTQSPEPHPITTEDILERRGDPEILDSYWPDLTTRVAGRELTGLGASPCFTEGHINCTNCHSVHDGDPAGLMSKGMESDRACGGCHPKITEAPSEHTHHRAGSEGSRCYNCHMPRIAYGLLSATRSHRIDSPRPTGFTTEDRPNACNLCHLDQSLGWTDRALRSWYGAPAADLPQEHRELSAGVLWTLKGNAAQRIITAWHMGWAPAQRAAGTDWSPPYLAELMRDENAAIRYVASRALFRVPGYEDFDYDYVAHYRAGPDEDPFDDAARRLRARWQNKGATSDRPTLLLKNGALDAERVEALLEERDLRPVGIAE